LRTATPASGASTAPRRRTRTTALTPTAWFGSHGACVGTAPTRPTRSPTSPSRSTTRVRTGKRSSRPTRPASEGAAALFQVIAQRYLKGSIVLTTNRGIASWGQIFDDPMVAAAMLDRLLHRCTVLQIDGDSYRMRSHRARIET
jgi:hypothetical protein